jgi:hypothetical protein
MDIGLLVLPGARHIVDERPHGVVHLHLPRQVVVDEGDPLAGPRAPTGRGLHADLEVLLADAHAALLGLGDVLRDLVGEKEG